MKLVFNYLFWAALICFLSIPFVYSIKKELTKVILFILMFIGILFVIVSPRFADPGFGDVVAILFGFTIIVISVIGLIIYTSLNKNKTQ